jgi:hypothetical protein
VHRPVPQRAVAKPQPPDEQQRGCGGHQHQRGGQDEGHGGRHHDEHCADGDGGRRADDGRDLLRTGRHRLASGLDVVGHQRAMHRGDRIEADVDHGGREREREVRAAGAESDCEQPADRHRRAAHHERQAPAETARGAAVRPRADGQWNDQPGNAVDGHDHADQRRAVLDAREEHR